MPHSDCVLETPRLVVRLGGAADPPAIVRFYEDNREHLGPWEPIRAPEFYTPAYWAQRVALDRQEFAAGASLRLFVFRREVPDAVIGTVNFTSFIRGSGQMCNLGYALGEAHVGHGYMHEALEAAIRFVLEELNLHRIQANYMPHNARSGKVLERLGFVVEGRAKDFLMINGAWRDHVLTSLTNPAWRPPSAP